MPKKLPPLGPELRAIRRKKRNLRRLRRAKLQAWYKKVCLEELSCKLPRTTLQAIEQGVEKENAKMGFYRMGAHKDPRVQKAYNELLDRKGYMRR